MEPYLATKFPRRHIRRVNFSCAAVIWLLAATSLVRGASFTASLDRDIITLGETATLALAFEGGQSENVPTPSVSGLQFTQTGTSQSVNIINGAMSSTVTVNFTVAPRRTGLFSIPPLTASVGGQRLSTAPLKLTVTAASAPSADAVNSGSEVAFMKLSPLQKTIYEGQMLTVQLEVCWRDDAQDFGNFRLNGAPADGLIIGKIVQGQGRREQIGDRIYTVVPFTVALTATKSGTLSLGPFTASATYVVPLPNDQGGDPFFRQFFNQGRQVPVSLATETMNAQCLPLPAENKPADFTGAVGNFTMNATAGPTTVTVGDPITVRVQISGRGALDAVTLPPPEAWQNFKTYPPTTKLETSDQFGFQGTKTFEQIISPQNSDVHELPAPTFSFFNPDDGQYHTLTQPAVPLVVKAAGATPMPTLAANKNSAPESQTPQDILPVKENPGTLSQTRIPLVTQPVFLVAQVVPVLALLAAVIWRKRTDNLANNPRLRRQRAVAQLVRDGLNDLKKFAVENKSDEFFALLFRLFQEQLGERLDCPATAITENVIEEHSVLRGAPQTTLDSLRELFQLCNHARYAPVRGASELNSVATKFENTVAKLQEVKV
jgi:hypothetical protein